MNKVIVLSAALTALSLTGCVATPKEAVEPVYQPESITFSYTENTALYYRSASLMLCADYFSSLPDHKLEAALMRDSYSKSLGAFAGMASTSDTISTYDKLAIQTAYNELVKLPSDFIKQHCTKLAKGWGYGI